MTVKIKKRNIIIWFAIILVVISFLLSILYTYKLTISKYENRLIGDTTLIKTLELIENK